MTVTTTTNSLYETCLRSSDAYVADQIEILQGVGAVSLVFSIDARTRAEAVTETLEMLDEFNATYYGTYTDYETTERVRSDLAAVGKVNTDGKRTYEILFAPSDAYIDEQVESMREVGSAELVFFVDGESRAKALKEVMEALAEAEANGAVTHSNSKESYIRKNMRKVSDKKNALAYI